jgi:D-amino-acid dehydrogenase
MRVLVLGAGVVGLTTAYHLAKDRAEVVVIDRQPGPALETSFANGGQISVNHATPWAGPGTPWKALKWLGQIDAPLLLHLRLDPQLAAWLVRFLANCRTSRVRLNTARALRLALYSREQLAVLRDETGIRYDLLQRGILHIFRNPEDYAQSLPGVELMNRLGCERRVVSAEECVALEPALAGVREQLVGGSFSPADESGDAHAFSIGLAELCAGLGVRFRYGARIRRLRAAPRAGAARKAGAGRVVAVEIEGGGIDGVEEIAADAVVVALGSWSPLLLKPLGISLPVYPAKGYSVTIPVGDTAAAPTVSLIDDEFKMVYSRLGDRLRVAGTAEFTGYDDRVVEARARSLLDRAMGLFPRCGDPARAEFWAGLRPSTPDGVPVIGRVPGFDNLWLNTGHGTLGWTMAAGSGRAVADLVLGRRPEISLDGLGLERFH